MRKKFHTTLRYCVLATALIMVTACDNPYIKQLKDEFGWTEARMLRDGWLKSYSIGQPPVYCYHTLADADCFARPQLGEKTRLLNSAYDGDF